MPPGRPRITTTSGARPPVGQIATADPYNYGVTINPLSGTVAPWHQFIDWQEDIPELMWPNSVRTTYPRMREDSQLAALVTSVMWGITQLRYILEPNGARASLVKEISEDLNVSVKGKEDQPTGRMKRRFSHSKFVLQALLSVIYGHMFFEQNGDIVDGKWRLRKLFPIMPQTIAQINVMPDGGLSNIIQWSTQGTVGSMGTPIDVDRLTCFVFQMEGMNWLGRSMMKDCFRDWTVKDRLVRIEAINHERAGGVPYANAPMGATVDEVEDLDSMMRQFKIGDSSGGAIPYGAELHIAKGTGSDIDKTIRRYDESMARRFLLMLANLAQGGQHVGSYALGETFEDFFLVGQRHIAQWYCDTVNEHVIEDIADWNYGENEEYVPKLTWERTSEDSLGVEQLAELVQRGVIIVDDELENAVRYKYQLPQRSGPRPAEVVGPGIPRQPPELPPGTPSAGGQSDAPSSGAPAPVKASFWDKIKRKPDVQATGPVLVTVPNVEICHAGVEYKLSTGFTTFTPEDLRDAATAAMEDPSVPKPRIKIGHIDPRYNSSEYDGTPAFGRLDNLRLSENGMSLYADLVGVPKWLADIMPSAFPNRSVEGYWGVDSAMANYKSGSGKQWRLVLPAVSLLGVYWPGVTILEDLPQYYGEEMPEGVTLDWATAMAGGEQEVKLRRKKEAASANLDDVRRAFYAEYGSDPEMRWWWICAVLTDPNELVVEDDESGQLYKISFSSDGEGTVDFGEPEPVKIQYVPETPEAQKAAASHMAAVLSAGRVVMASWPTREDSVLPATTQGGAMDPKEVRKRLGLPEDASDEQVRETLLALNSAAGVPVAESTEEPDDGDEGNGEEGEGNGEGEGTPEPAAPESQQLQVAASGVQLPPGVVLVSEAALKQLTDGATEAIDFVAKQKDKEREGLVMAAIADGRIPPADKDHWLKQLKETPSGAATLAALKSGLIPVELRGEVGVMSHEGTVNAALAPEVVSAWSEQIFPEVRQRHAEEAALASGGRRSRVSADQAYRR